MESDRHYVTIHMADGTKIVTAEKLKDLEEKMNEPRFLHCHQSYLVNMDYIKDVKDDFILKDDTIIPRKTGNDRSILQLFCKT